MGHASADGSSSEHPATGGHRAVHRRSLRAVPAGPGVGAIIAGLPHLAARRRRAHVRSRHARVPAPRRATPGLSTMPPSSWACRTPRPGTCCGRPRSISAGRWSNAASGAPTGGGTSLTQAGPRPPEAVRDVRGRDRRRDARMRSMRRSATGRLLRADRRRAAAVSLPIVDPRARPLAEATPAGHPIYRELVDAHRAGSPGHLVHGRPRLDPRRGRTARPGLALTLHDGVFESQLPGRINGAETRWLAERITSWNMFEASLALGAINSWFNRRDRVERLLGQPLVGERGTRLFERLQRAVRGRLGRRRRPLPAPRAPQRALRPHHPRAPPLGRRPARPGLRVPAGPAGLRVHHRQRRHQQDAAAAAGAEPRRLRGPRRPERPAVHRLVRLRRRPARRHGRARPGRPPSPPSSRAAAARSSATVSRWSSSRPRTWARSPHA